MCRLMKNYVFLAMSAALLAACSNDVALDNTGTQSAETVDNAIGFQFINRNSVTSRVEGSTADEATTKRLLNNNGHYNFGVFAYKSSLTGSATFSLSTASKVMENYLVGYGSKTGETAAGYKLDESNQTTINSSRWAYEKLGSKEYSNTEENGFYKSTGTGADFYLSNNDHQYLKYWDLSTSQTDFFAYAPYLNGANTAKVETKDSKTLISFPMTDGYDDASKYDFIAAHKKVEKSGYSESVQIDFKRLSAMIRIGFYEEIAGYQVKILNLKQETGDDAVGVSAAPAKKNTSGTPTYSYGTLYYKGTGTGTYPATSSTNDDNVEVSVQGASDGVYSNTATGSTHKYLNFKIPVLASGAYISTNKDDPSMSDTKYYLIPDNGTNKTGLTFHVTYQLIAEDTGETITVYNATVHVPYQKADDENTKYCDWKSNYVYTYIFRLTKGTSGDTDDKDKDKIDPSDPDADDKQALKPIIFDNCTVEKWDETKKYEFDIN